jgi:uncharacterized delta-60 repeat protein
MALTALLGLGGACDSDEKPGEETTADALSDDNAVPGRDGRDGKDGRDGANGRDGKDGAPGANGTNGVSGTDGKDGLDGLDGADGVNGTNGRDGRDGLNGRDGRDGTGGVIVADGGVADASGEPEAAAPIIAALSATGHDRFYGVTHDADGNIYATGQVASGIVVQSTGKIVIAGAAEHDPKAAGLLANDTDIVLVRWNADGSLDSTFGNRGVVVLDLNSGVVTPNTMGVDTLTGGDSQWALSVTPDDKLIVHGTQRAEGFQTDGVTPRTDNDWALVRLSADGVLDSTFSGDGKVTLDIGGAGASARAVTLLDDGGIIAAGYLNSMVLGQSATEPVLYKVDADGEFDDTFATADAWAAPGVWHDFALQPPLGAECYGAAINGDHLITIGYGPTNGTGSGSDWVSLRFSLDGVRDTTYGTSLGGATYIDADGYGDNGRSVLVLPHGRIMGVGGGRPAPETAPPAGTNPPGDAMIAILSEDGVPDESFAPDGFQLYDLGGAADFFWAADVQPDQKHVAVVGIASGATAGVNDDNAVLFLLPVGE